MACSGVSRHRASGSPPARTCPARWRRRRRFPAAPCWRPSQPAKPPFFVGPDGGADDSGVPAALCKGHRTGGVVLAADPARVAPEQARAGQRHRLPVAAHNAVALDGQRRASQRRWPPARGRQARGRWTATGESGHEAVSWAGAAMRLKQVGQGSALAERDDAQGPEAGKQQAAPDPIGGRPSRW